MNNATRRAIVLVVGFAMVAAACGDDDATSRATTPPATGATTAPPATEAPETTEAPATTTTAAPTTTTTAAPATTQPAALDPAQLVADHMIPLPANTELVSAEEVDGGGLRVGAIVNASPPPGYAATATAAGWTVLDVRFGSETTVAVFGAAVYCLIAYANYDASDSVDYWMYFTFFTGLTEEDCLAATDALISALSLLGRP